MKKISIESAKMLNNRDRILVNHESEGLFAGTIKVAEEGDLKKRGVEIGHTLVIYDSFGFDNFHEYVHSDIEVYLLEEGDACYEK